MQSDDLGFPTLQNGGSLAVVPAREWCELLLDQPDEKGCC